jgi:predicted O-methyltransferase YrrM
MKFSLDELNLINTEFGPVSTQRFYEEVNEIKNGTLVELGVYMGASSRLLIDKCIENNNKIIGIDPIPHFTSSNPNYHYWKADSVQVGKEWDKGEVDLVFFDSVHAKEQVLCELYYWWSLIKEGGKAIFHDTSWKDYVHKEGHSCAGKLTGNTALGYDTYGGIDWDTPDKAVKEFFGIEINIPERDINKDEVVLIHEDENIKVEMNYACLGMTFIHKKKNYDYKNNIQDWEEVFRLQKILLSNF